jgi:hypothetical protein
MEHRRRDDTSLDDRVRTVELLYERLDSRVHSAETITNEARAEFRSIRDELKKDISNLRISIVGDAIGEQPGLRQDIAALKIAQTSKERREGYRWAFATAFWPVVVVQFLILAGLVLVNWDKIQEFILLHEHIHQAAVIEANTKKLKTKRAAGRKPRPPPQPVKEEVPDETP